MRTTEKKQEIFQESKEILDGTLHVEELRIPSQIHVKYVPPRI